MRVNTGITKKKYCLNLLANSLSLYFKKYMEIGLDNLHVGARRVDTPDTPFHLSLEVCIKGETETTDTDMSWLESWSG